jgi:hypothetical protein
LCITVHLFRRLYHGGDWLGKSHSPASFIARSSSAGLHVWKIHVHMQVTPFTEPSLCLPVYVPPVRIHGRDVNAPR